MGNIDSWLGESPALSEWTAGACSQADATRIVADKPTRVVVVRGAKTFDPQTVRIEALGSPREVAGEGGQTALAEAVIIAGAGADLQRGDRFKAGGLAYEIVAMVPGLAGSVQAYARVRA